MVKRLQKRGLLTLTQGSGTEVYTAREVVNYLKRIAQSEASADPAPRPSLASSDAEEAWS